MEKDLSPLMLLAASAKVVVSEILDELVPLVSADSWTIPTFLTIDEVSQLIGKSKDELENLCAEGVFPAMKVDEEWRIESNAVLTFWSGDLTHSAIALLFVASHLMGQGGHASELASELNKIASYLSEIMGE